MEVSGGNVYFAAALHSAHSTRTMQSPSLFHPSLQQQPQQFVVVSMFVSSCRSCERSHDPGGGFAVPGSSGESD